MKEPCVYILASREYGTIYIGVTSDLIRRLHQHRNGQVKGFTSKYKVHRLVRFEQFATMYDAIFTREAAEVLASAVEDQFDRKRESALG